jgi:hypothetical protein
LSLGSTRTGLSVCGKTPLSLSWSSEARRDSSDGGEHRRACLVQLAPTPPPPPPPLSNALHLVDESTAAEVGAERHAVVQGCSAKARLMAWQLLITSQCLPIN